MEGYKRVAQDPVLCDQDGNQKPPRFSVNSDLMEKPCELGVGRVVSLEDALALEVHRRRREAWLEENREAIESYNEHVKRDGVFSAGLRGF